MMASKDKYDRQIRLWGSNGQKLLAMANVLVLGSGPTASETMKNLVLPGLGSFVMVDKPTEVVDEGDLCNNFFVTREYLGQQRAKVVVELLLEMNPDVRGRVVLHDPIGFIESKDRAKGEFQLVIASGMMEAELLRVADACEKLNVNLLIARSFGMIGHVRICGPEILIKETKPSPMPAEDIRIANPFEELKSFAASLNLEDMDNRDYKHVPYVVILIKLMDAWVKNHGYPKTQSEKSQFRETIKAAARLPWGEEENLKEALDSAYLAYTVRSIPMEVQDILNDPRISDEKFVATKEVDPFWILARALKVFVANNHGLLPLSGRLPDMTSTTSLYIQLQHIYQARSASDLETISNIVDDILEQAGLPLDFVSKEDRECFCKNAYYLQAISFRSFREELLAASANKEAISMAIMPGVGDDSPQCPILWYFAWRACDRFKEEHGRYPGACKSDAELDQDAQGLHKILTNLVRELDLDSTALSSDHAEEMARYAGLEFHNIAALVGGVAAQEAVKIITKQYTPLNNSFIYNGITCTGGVYEL